jgi:P-type E1-E2 ATPase
MVENVFEKSMLVEIGTQIKFSQNQEQDKAEGIQAVCKSIANVFVKSVIFLSLLTMAVWAVLLKFNFVHMEKMCGICWVVERGIGVLVASCPCALGLAVPSVIAIILNLATKSGILIKNNGVFEKMKITKKISFDKTGTLFTRINKIEEYHI